MSEQDTVELDYAFHGTLPDGWHLHPLTGRPTKCIVPMSVFKKNRLTASHKQADFARRFNAHFETTATDRATPTSKE